MGTARQPCGHGRAQSPTVKCPTCGGIGDVRHPRYGTRSCPVPYVTCNTCGGEGWVFRDELEPAEE